MRKGMYTDDTTSILALATSLVKCQGLDGNHVARSYGDWWLLRPFRGYPDTAMAVLRGVLEGMDPGITGRLAFPNGSFANGAAMRIAPVGLAFRNATDDQLRVAVANAVISSHTHPVAIDAAAVLAKGIAFNVNHRAMNQPDDPEHPLPEFDAGDFLDALAGVARTPPMLCALRSMREHLSKPTWPGLVWAFSSLQRDDMPADEPPLAVSEDMCDPTFCRSWFQIHSAVAVSCSLWAFLSSASRPADASCAVADIAAIAVDLGGDADTVGSMAGALAGALHGAGRPNADGYEHIPPAWWHQIENGTYGRDFIVDTARGLADLELREPSVAIPVANRVAEALASSGGGLSQAEQQDLHLAARRAYQPIEAQQSLKLYREQHAREALPVDDPPEPAASL